MFIMTITIGEGHAESGWNAQSGFSVLDSPSKIRK